MPRSKRTARSPWSAKSEAPPCHSHQPVIPPAMLRLPSPRTPSPLPAPLRDRVTTSFRLLQPAATSLTASRHLARRPAPVVAGRAGRPLEAGRQERGLEPAAPSAKPRPAARSDCASAPSGAATPPVGRCSAGRRPGRRPAGPLGAWGRDARCGECGGAGGRGLWMQEMTGRKNDHDSEEENLGP